MMLVIRTGSAPQRRRISVWSVASRFLAFTATVLVMASCGDEGGTSGPCYVRYDDPLFTIASATDVRTQTSIPQVMLRRFSYNDRSDLGIDFLTNQFGLTPHNVSISSGAFVCDIDCAFGAIGGQYTFTFYAAGYQDTTFTIDDAEYMHASGNCPSIQSGGLTLHLVLTPK